MEVTLKYHSKSWGGGGGKSYLNNGSLLQICLHKTNDHSFLKYSFTGSQRYITLAV